MGAIAGCRPPAVPRRCRSGCCSLRTAEPKAGRPALAPAPQSGPEAQRMRQLLAQEERLATLRAELEAKEAALAGAGKSWLGLLSQCYGR